MINEAWEQENRISGVQSMADYQQNSHQFGMPEEIQSAEQSRKPYTLSSPKNEQSLQSKTIP